MRKVFIALLVAATPAVPAWAGDYWCNSKAVEIGITNDNGLWLLMNTASGQRWMFMCYIAPTATSPHPSMNACQSIQASLLTAKAQNTNVNIHFVGSSTYTSCEANPGWNMLDVPVWVAIQN